MGSWLFRQWGKIHRNRRLIERESCGDGAHLVDELERGMAIPDDLIDAVLNDEVASESSGAVFAALRREPGAMEELEQTEYTIDALKSAGPGKSPRDLTSAILGKVDAHQPLLNSRRMKLVWIWRTAAVAAVVLLAAGLFVVQRVSPASVTMTNDSMPLSALMQSMPDEPTTRLVAQQGKDDFRARLEAVRSQGMKLTEAPSTACRRKRCCPYQRVLAPTATHLIAVQWMAMVSQDTFRVPMTWGSVRPVSASNDFATIRGLYTESSDDAQRGVGGADLFHR